MLTVAKAAFIYSPALEKFQYPPDCPFNTSRAGRLRKVLASMGLLAGQEKTEIAPQPATRLILKKFHTARYLHALKVAEKGQWDIEALSMGIGSADCPIFKGMYYYAALATGATLTAARLILDGLADIAFNPSGGFHHAGPEKAAGFCYLNDVALACMMLAEKGMKVLYLDIDVHHGDGVQQAFYDRADVMTISLHESGRTLFPGTGFEDEIGTGEGLGYSVNMPLPVGTYDQAYMLAFSEVVVPLTAAYNPDVIVFEFGADALAGDPLAHLYLTNNVYADIAETLLGFGRPILVTGGGGYNIPNTVRAWALAWSVLCGAAGGYDSHVGAGGVMLESTDWHGGLRDRTLVIGSQQRETVIPAIEETIEKIKSTIFPLHGL